MKKIIIIGLGILLFTGCDDVMNTPTKRVEEFLGKYQTMDRRSEKMGYKIREAQLKKIPYGIPELRRRESYLRPCGCNARGGLVLRCLLYTSAREVMEWGSVHYRFPFGVRQSLYTFKVQDVGIGAL